MRVAETRLYFDTGQFISRISDRQGTFACQSIGVDSAKCVKIEIRPRWRHKGEISSLCSNDPWVRTCVIHVYAEGRPNSGYHRYRVRGIACRLIDAGLLAASFGHEGVNWRNITRRLPTARVVRCIINLKLHCTRNSERDGWKGTEGLRETWMCIGRGWT